MTGAPIGRPGRMARRTRRSILPGVLRVTILLVLALPVAVRAAVRERPADLTDLTLEQLLQIEVITGASKYEQKVTAAPASITVVTADEIRAFGYRTLAEILQSVRGFYVRDDRNYAFVGVRGFGRLGDYNTRVLLMVDGHRLNEDIFDGLYVGTEGPLDVDLIERIEVIRGPGSSLYGTNALLAVVNVVTRSGQGLGGFEASASLGSYRSREGRLSYGGKLPGGADLLLSGSRYRSGGQNLFFPEFDDPATHDGVAADSDRDRYYRLFGKLAIGRVRVQAAHSSRVKSVPTASFGTIFNDGRELTVDSHSYLDVTYERPFAGESEFTQRIYVDRYYYHGDYPFDYPPVTLFKDFTWGYWLGTETRLDWRISKKRRLVAGLEYRDHIRQDILNYDQDPFFLYLDERRSTWDGAIYVQNELALSGKWTLDLGVRHDRYETFGGTTNPRAAVIYSPSRHTTLKMLYGEAFRAPNAYEAFYPQGASAFKPNPGLRPETVRTVELVLERYWRSARLAGTAFRSAMSDLVSLKTDPGDGLFFFDNDRGVRTIGAEIELDWRWSGGRSLRFSHTWQASDDLLTEGTPVNSPRNLAKLNLVLPLGGPKLSAGIETQYSSRRKTLFGDGAAPFWVTNLTFVSRGLPGGLEVSVGAFNLFDRRYGEPGSEEHIQDTIEQNGRNLRTRLTFRF